MPEVKTYFTQDGAQHEIPVRATRRVAPTNMKAFDSMKECREAPHITQPLQWRDAPIRKNGVNARQPAMLQPVELGTETSRPAVYTNKKLRKTYADIRSAIAFITRNERGLSKHTITEAALAATKVILKGHPEQSEA